MNHGEIRSETNLEEIVAPAISSFPVPVFAIVESVAVQFCIDQLPMAEEVVTKLADAFWFLKAWSQSHADEAREYLRTECLQAQRPAKSASNYLIRHLIQ